MNVLVTGGAGYIGSVMVEQLIAQGHTAIVYDSLELGHRAAIAPEASFVQGRIQDKEKLIATFREHEVEAVIHMAAYALVGESTSNPSKYFANNFVGGLTLLDAMMETKVRKLVFSSTCATYGIPETMPITEETPQRPVNPYGESKLAFEKALRWYDEAYGLKYASMRYFNAAGATSRFGEHHRTETHLIPNVLKVPLGQTSHCEIYGTDYPTPDGTCIRDYIHILDLAQAHILALAPGKQGFYNLGNGDGYSVRQVISTCEQVSGKKIPAVEKPRRPGDPPKLVASAEKAIRELGWKPKYPKLEDIVATAWNWHRQHPQGYPD